MSFRKEKYLNYALSSNVAELSYMNEISDEDSKHLFLEILNNGIHGFCFSLYEEGQQPGDPISEDQIRRRLQILQPHTDWIRSFSCTQGHELIPVIAREFGIKTLVGAWLGSDEDKNWEEIDNLVELAEKGFVDIAAIGNEVLYRKDLNEHELINYIKEAKNRLPNIPVGYVDAYYEFVQRPAITDLCDVILCNCYPYWEGTSFEDSFQHMRQMYYQVQGVANGKKIIISETGWPSEGESLGGAVPGHYNAMKYFINTNLWSLDENIEVFYFSSFDESWKMSDEGAVGAYWGIWDYKENLKF